MAVYVDEDTSESAGTGYRFSWGLAFAGGAVAAAVTFFLLTLGSGVGLLFVRPLTGEGVSAPGFLTAGAIYFFVAQAFGFAAGGHLAGRLLGPLIESERQEEIRAALHGLVVWAVTVLGTLVLIGVAGAATAGLYGVARGNDAREGMSAYVVDKLFRPAADATPANVPQARAEAERIVELGFGRALDRGDRDRLAQLVAQQAGLSAPDAARRVAATQAQVTDRLRRAADTARKTASYASLWMAFSLLFGALVAMVGAVTARIEDGRETAWSLFAFRQGWRS